VIRPAVPPRHLRDTLRRWSPTRAFGRAVLVVGLLLVTAILLGRADLVVLAAPFALGAALGIWRRPSRLPLVQAWLGADFIGEGGRVPARLSVANPDALPHSYAEQRERDPLHRVVCDYIAGMTDRFILRQYEELFGKSDKLVFG